MKYYALLILLFSFTFCHAQKDISSLEISDKDVSRKKIQTIDGSVYSISRANEKPDEVNGDINIIKTDREGKIVWSKFYGGSGYEYIGSILKTKNNDLMIVATTSSFGEGNNDLYIVKTDLDGEEIWTRTYGSFFNEYGYYIKELNSGDFIVKGRQQLCEGKNVGNCQESEWVFYVDAEGKPIDKIMQKSKL